MVRFAEKVIHFYQTLVTPGNLPEGIEVMHPHLTGEVECVSSEFYRKFYSDVRPRTFIIGINPGRFGGGITGVPFTDPVKLETFCGIKHNLKGKTELSADFIYNVIQQYGGVESFYRDFYFTSVAPLGFIKNGLNLNYYDDKELVETLRPRLGEWLQQQVDFGANRDFCICLGSGKNHKYLMEINLRYSFFKRIEVVEHPRFIMQYRRRNMLEFVEKYINVLGQNNAL